MEQSRYQLAYCLSYFKSNARLLRKFVEAKRLRPHKTCALMMELRGRQIKTTEVENENGVYLKSG